MVGKYCDGRIPDGRAAPAGSLVADWAREAAARLPARLEAVALHELAEHAMELFRAANGLAEREQPWKAAKDPAKAGAVRDVLYVLAEAVRAGSALLAPILPTKAAAALAQLGAPPAGDLRAHLSFGVLAPGTPIAPGPVLFPRLE
jgi:methionyl-tRNA synthetase